MEVKILLFGIARDIVGKSSVDFQLGEGQTVKDFLEILKNKYPAFNDLNSLMVAVNSDYAKDNLVLKAEDEIALIPPVSGG